MKEKFREALRLFFNTLLSNDEEFQRVPVSKPTEYEKSDRHFGGGGSVGGLGPSTEDYIKRR